MQELPGNSHAKNPGPKAEPETKRVEQVVHVGVSTKKRSFGKRLRESLFPGHAETVGEYLVWDVLIPSAKDVIADMGTTFFERMLFGEARPSSRRGSLRPGQNDGRVNYNRMSGSGTRMAQDPRGGSGRNDIRSGARDFDDIVFESRLAAQACLTGMWDTIGRYQAVTIADMYDLVGLTGDYTASDWGWVALPGTDADYIRRSGSGYILDLPAPERMN